MTVVSDIYLNTREGGTYPDTSQTRSKPNQVAAVPVQDHAHFLLFHLDLHRVTFPLGPFCHKTVNPQVFMIAP